MEEGSVLISGPYNPVCAYSSGSKVTWYRGSDYQWKLEGKRNLNLGPQYLF